MRLRVILLEEIVSSEEAKARGAKKRGVAAGQCGKIFKNAVAANSRIFMGYSR